MSPLTYLWNTWSVECASAQSCNGCCAEANDIRKSTFCTSTNRHIRKPQVQINSSEILVGRALHLWSSKGPQAYNISVVTLAFGTPGPPRAQVEAEAAAV
jgi:hypothetical protein